MKTESRQASYDHSVRPWSQFLRSALTALGGWREGKRSIRVLVLPLLVLQGGNYLVGRIVDRGCGAMHLPVGVLCVMPSLLLVGAGLLSRGCMIMSRSCLDFFIRRR